MVTKYIVYNPEQEMVFLPPSTEDDEVNGRWEDCCLENVERIKSEYFRSRRDVAEILQQHLSIQFPHYNLILLEKDIGQTSLCPTCRFYNLENKICGENKDMSVHQYDCLSYFEKQEVDKYINTHAIKNCRRWTEKEDTRIKELTKQKRRLISELGRIDNEYKEITGLDYDEQEEYYYWIDDHKQRIPYQELSDLHLVAIFKQLALNEKEREVTVRWFKVKEEVLMRWGFSYLQKEKGGYSAILSVLIEEAIQSSGTAGETIHWQDIADALIDKVVQDSGVSIIESIRQDALYTAAGLEDRVTQMYQSWENLWLAKEKEMYELQNQVRKNLTKWIEDKTFNRVTELIIDITLIIEGLRNKQKQELLPQLNEISIAYEELRKILQQNVSKTSLFISKKITEQTANVLEQMGYKMDSITKGIFCGNLESFIKQIEQQKQSKEQRKALLAINELADVKDERRKGRDKKTLEDYYSPIPSKLSKYVYKDNPDTDHLNTASLNDVLMREGNLIRTETISNYLLYKENEHQEQEEERRLNWE